MHARIQVDPPQIHELHSFCLKIKYTHRGTAGPLRKPLVLARFVSSPTHWQGSAGAPRRTTPPTPPSCRCEWYGSRRTTTFENRCRSRYQESNNKRRRQQTRKSHSVQRHRARCVPLDDPGPARSSRVPRHRGWLCASWTRRKKRHDSAPSGNVEGIRGNNHRRCYLPSTQCVRRPRMGVAPARLRSAGD